MEQIGTEDGIGEVLSLVSSQAANEVAFEAESMIRDFEMHSIPDEETFSSDIAGFLRRTLSGRIARKLNDLEDDDFNIYARVVSKHREETDVGADLAISLGFNMEDYVDSRAVLVQSKTYKNRKKEDKYNCDKLAEEAQQMLSYSSESYIWVFPYHHQLAVIPAQNILGLGFKSGLDGQYPDNLPTVAVSDFIKEFAHGFIGDPLLTPPAMSPLSWRQPDTVRQFLDDVDIDTVLQIYVSDENIPPSKTDGIYDNHDKEYRIP